MTLNNNFSSRKPCQMKILSGSLFFKRISCLLKFWSTSCLFLVHLKEGINYFPFLNDEFCCYSNNWKINLLARENKRIWWNFIQNKNFAKINLIKYLLKENWLTSLPSLIWPSPVFPLNVFNKSLKFLTQEIILPTKATIGLAFELFLKYRSSHKENS